MTAMEREQANTLGQHMLLCEAEAEGQAQEQGEGQGKGDPLLSWLH